MWVLKAPDSIQNSPHIKTPGKLKVDPLYGSTVVFNTKLVRQIYKENDLLMFPNFFFQF